MSTSGEVFVISDLHLGGQPAADRGFRLMTRPDRLAAFVDFLCAKPKPVELIINGDFVDFLAEQHEEAPRWRPLVLDEAEALAIFERVVGRPGDGAVFDALRKLLERGHRLTILLGNHDLELSLPAVRRRLVEVLGGDGRLLSFVYDNEALVRGDALIEHGNRYDRFNQVDHDGLRRARSSLSRRQSLPDRASFAPPPGSQMVAKVMNPLKEKYAFVDLLKPETAAVFPMLLALDPSVKSQLMPIANVLGPSVFKGIDADAQPKFAGDISSSSAAEMDFAGDISSSSPAADSWFSRLFQLFLNGNDPVKRRAALLGALRTLVDDQSFSREVETAKEYSDAAGVLISKGFKYVVFGHTHLPKRVALGTGVYLNSGTWADRIKVPAALFVPDEGEAAKTLDRFVADLEKGALTQWLFREFTFVHLVFDGDRVKSADVETWPEN